MGQSISQTQRPGREERYGRDRQSRRRYSVATLLDNLHTVGHQSTEDAGVLLDGQDDVPVARNRLSRLLRSPDDITPSRSALQRSRSTISSMFRRPRHRTSYLRAESNEESFHPPRLPSIDRSSTFDQDLFWDRAESPPRSRRSNIFHPLPFRHLTRRRSPPPISRTAPEDQAILLSQLLSAAAAATAATLMGDDHQALNEARSLSLGNSFGEVTGAEDGSFAGFLRALSSGRFASALRQNGAEEPETHNPMNFFRMFRFGNTIREADSDGRMIPIIIVGIRSISPNTTSSDDLPPFLDALTNFTSPADDLDLGHDSIDSILRPPRNGTSFRHRRRASMGGFGLGRTPERRRPWSTSSNEPRPPPATPASPSPELSRIPSSNSTPAQSRPTSLIANSIRELGDRTLHRSLSSPLASHTEENIAELPFRRPDNASIHYPRFASGHPRRNGVVEPDHIPLSRSSAERNDSRSWIIYVLGGSYPENHPILTTPSLFSDNPTYEDMMLLSALLGPAKAPVATDEDVQSSGGLYVVTEKQLATAVEGIDAIALEASHRCLVCLGDFEVKETLRRLGKCGHLFHQECIDHWLTQGRNSCPLCRGEGVEEKSKPETEQDTSPVAS